ncbi:hypothetical protein GGQ97_001375 [Sphingomonas kaistensis]|jgi:hypothetical protein|uniref:Uncharacterized protein n=2 Tax=Sphingomonas TaxID=13687 RepID=A0A7X5Y6P2_9SPHN|nr:hypothetical protein [Sphingomonas kaistensis]NJC05582.1 hypothetical protein [Sphingomonas kaistensis]
MKHDRPVLGGFAVALLALLLTLVAFAAWRALSPASSETNDAILDERAAKGKL